VTGQEIKNWCRVTLADYKITDLVSFLDRLRARGRPGVSSWPALLQADQQSRRA
jgi:hypothetical protein